jgi:hypothetical protein
VKVIIEQHGELTRVIVEGRAICFNECQLDGFLDALDYESARLSRESHAVYEIPDSWDEPEPEGPTIQ